ncbi:DUF3560 domain-containing protein, partial [Streptomyces noursei]
MSDQDDPEFAAYMAQLVPADPSISAPEQTRAERSQWELDRLDAKSDVPRLGWSKQIAEAAAWACQDQLTVSAAGVFTAAGKRVAAPRVRLLEAAGFVTVPAPKQRGPVRATADGRRASRLATVYPEGLATTDKDAKAARFAAAAKGRVSKQQARDESEHLPFLPGGEAEKAMHKRRRREVEEWAAGAAARKAELEAIVAEGERRDAEREAERQRRHAEREAQRQAREERAFKRRMAQWANSSNTNDKGCGETMSGKRRVKVERIMPGVMWHATTRGQVFCAVNEAAGWVVVAPDDTRIGSPVIGEDGEPDAESIRDLVRAYLDGEPATDTEDNAAEERTGNGFTWADVRRRPAVALVVGDVFVVPAVGVAYKELGGGAVRGAGVGAGMALEGVAWTVVERLGALFTAESERGERRTELAGDGVCVLRVEGAAVGASSSAELLRVVTDSGSGDSGAFFSAGLGAGAGGAGGGGGVRSGPVDGAADVSVSEGVAGGVGGYAPVVDGGWELTPEGNYRCRPASRAAALDLAETRWAVECDRHGPMTVLVDIHGEPTRDEGKAGRFECREDAEEAAALHLDEHQRREAGVMTPEEIEEAQALALSQGQDQLMDWAAGRKLVERVDGFWGADVSHKRDDVWKKAYRPRVLIFWAAGYLDVEFTGPGERELVLTAAGRRAHRLWNRALKLGVVEYASKENRFGAKAADVRRYPLLSEDRHFDGEEPGPNAAERQAAEDAKAAEVARIEAERETLPAAAVELAAAAEAVGWRVRTQVEKRHAGVQGWRDGDGGAFKAIWRHEEGAGWVFLIGAAASDFVKINDIRDLDGVRRCVCEAEALAAVKVADVVSAPGVEVWGDEGGYCPGVEAPRPVEVPEVEDGQEEPQGSDADIVITHTPAEGTQVHGTSRGDEAGKILKRKEYGRKGGMPFKWSGDLECWVLYHSRDEDAQDWTINKVRGYLEEAGYTVDVVIDNDVERSVAEAEAEKAGRAVERTARYEEYAANAATRSEAKRGRADQISERFYMGQPIILGRGARTRADFRARDRMHDATRASIEEHKKSQHWAERAAAAANYEAFRNDPWRTLRRMDDLRKELRDIERRRAEYAVTGKPMTPERAAQLDRWERRVKARLTYWEGVIAQAEAEDGFHAWGPADFAKGDYVNDGGTWREVLRVSSRSVTVPTGLVGWAFLTAADLQGSRSEGRTRTLPYDAVRGQATAAEVEQWKAAEAGELTECPHCVRVANGALRYSEARHSCTVCGHAAGREFVARPPEEVQAAAAVKPKAKRSDPKVPKRVHVACGWNASTATVTWLDGRSRPHPSHAAVTLTAPDGGVYSDSVHSEVLREQLGALLAERGLRRRSRGTGGPSEGVTWALAVVEDDQAPEAPEGAPVVEERQEEAQGSLCGSCGREVQPDRAAAELTAECSASHWGYCTRRPAGVEVEEAQAEEHAVTIAAASAGGFDGRCSCNGLYTWALSRAMVEADAAEHLAQHGAAPAETAPAPAPAPGAVVTVREWLKSAAGVGQSASAVESARWEQGPALVFIASRKSAPTRARGLWVVTREEAMRLCSHQATHGRSFLLAWTERPGVEGEDWAFVRDTGSFDGVLAELGVTPRRVWDVEEVARFPESCPRCFDRDYVRGEVCGACPTFGRGRHEVPSVVQAAAVASLVPAIEGAPVRAALEAPRYLEGQRVVVTPEPATFAGVTVCGLEWRGVFVRYETYGRALVLQDGQRSPYLVQAREVSADPAPSAHVVRVLEMLGDGSSVRRAGCDRTLNRVTGVACSCGWSASLQNPGHASAAAWGRAHVKRAEAAEAAAGIAPRRVLVPPYVAPARVFAMEPVAAVVEGQAPPVAGVALTRAQEAALLEAAVHESGRVPVTVNRRVVVALARLGLVADADPVRTCGRRDCAPGTLHK